MPRPRSPVCTAVDASPCHVIHAQAGQAESGQVAQAGAHTRSVASRCNRSGPGCAGQVQGFTSQCWSGVMWPGQARLAVPGVQAKGDHPTTSELPRQSQEAHAGQTGSVYSARSHHVPGSAKCAAIG